MKRENAAKTYYGFNLILFTAIIVGFGLVCCILPLTYVIRKEPNTEQLWLLPICVSLAVLPFLIYHLIQYIHYANVRFDNIQRGTVVDCDTEQFGRRMARVGFYVRLEKERKTVLTKRCHRAADGYLNTLVEVGYDPKRGEWIILED